ncbi:AMP-binding protein [Mycolicibacterium sp. 050232]|uniref:AMP-binding protein n=1 Tax=Mycolicibacterium sp. 050232 TaxID=3113982 RepID=UPI002E2D7510|nr:AMP-binding protein [Mycolicibacterium sp. 050232]MED5812617.1 AMP-binding protein [Mycolicibacterium sp. 050232]
MVHAIEQYARQDATAVALSDGTTSWTWPQLDELLNRAVNWLLTQRISPDQRVAVMGANSVHVALAHLATTYAGLSAVPVNYHLTADEVGYILRDAAVHTVLCSADVADTVRAAAAGAQVLTWSELDAAAGQYPHTSPPVDIAPAKPLYYTSGTTGYPKGVELPDQMFPGGTSMVEYVQRVIDSPIGTPGRHLVVAPMHHTGPMAGVRGILAGRPLVVLPKFDAEQVLATIGRERVEATMMVPTHFSRLLQLPAEVRDRYDVSSMRSIVHTGAACPVEVKRAMIDWFGPILVEAYGSTEAGTVTLINSAEWLERPGSVGRAMPGCELSIRSEAGELLPSGTTGLVCIKSAHRPSYHGDPEKTRRSYVADGVFALGEIGHLDADGYLYLTDRASDMVVSGGVNVYPAESEAVLRRHPAVADVAVIGIPHDDLGEQLCALVVSADPGADPAELVAWTREHLAHYKCPNLVEIVDFDLRSVMGKLNKRQLRDRYLTRTAVAPTPAGRP